MLKIRLARHGRNKRPFYRIVLTEHLKPVHAGYQEVFGWFDPLAHKIEVDVDAIKGWILKGAKPSERVAKLLFKETKDDLFSQYFVERERKREVRNPSEEEIAAKEAAANLIPKEEAKPEIKEEVKLEVKKEDKKEDKKAE